MRYPRVNRALLVDQCCISVIITRKHLGINVAEFLREGGREGDEGKVRRIDSLIGRFVVAERKRGGGEVWKEGFIAFRVTGARAGLIDSRAGSEV